MKISDFNRLKKMMMLAANNSNDAEAIRAFRAATEIVRVHGYTWEQVMDRRVTVLSSVEAGDESETSAPGRSGKPPVSTDGLEERDFELALLNIRSTTFRETLESIYEQWENDTPLSPRQIEVVRNAADKAR